jgi:Kef-type K+ transport system membrane component KefB
MVAVGAILVLIAVGMSHFAVTLTELSDLGRDGGTFLGKLLLAIGLIIAVGALGGRLAGRCGQPRVVGEMVAGIALGPSLLGQLAPEIQRWLFPGELIPHLGLIAQLAVIVFVFLLGANLPLRLLHGSGHQVVALGVGMVVVPVLSGVLLAVWLSGTYRPDGVPPISFLLFVGVAMGVTAFPVLIMILAERGLIASRIGTLGLTAAGIGDAIAWCLLAIVVATAQRDSLAVPAQTVALLLGFAVLVRTVLRPALRRFLLFAERSAAPRISSATVLLLSAVSGAFLTDRIGVHTIFGAFLVGLAVPRDSRLVQQLARTIERGVGAVLPLFFAVVGLNLQLGLLSDPRELLVCGVLVAVAMASKIGTTTLIGRATRLPWRESVGLGVMVNCRGLTELVVVATGLSLGIIGPDLFGMLVVMTLVTTMMTGPLLSRLTLNGTDPDRAGPESRPAATNA